MATTLTSLSVATSESLFPLEIMTKQFHFNHLVFLKANQRGLRALTTFTFDSTDTTMVITVIPLKGYLGVYL